MGWARRWHRMTGKWRLPRFRLARAGASSHWEADGRPRMTRIELEAAARDAFLADRRLGILTLHGESGAPIARPLWYGWNGREVEMISASVRPGSAGSRKTHAERSGHEHSAGARALGFPRGARDDRSRLRPGDGRAPRKAVLDRLPSRRRHAGGGAGADLVRLCLVPDRIRSCTEIVALPLEGGTRSTRRE